MWIIFILKKIRRRLLLAENIIKQPPNSLGDITPVLPEVVSFAQYQVGLCVEGGADLSQSTVAAATLETVLMPEQV